MFQQNLRASQERLKTAIRGKDLKNHDATDGAYIRAWMHITENVPYHMVINPKHCLLSCSLVLSQLTSPKRRNFKSPQTTLASFAKQLADVHANRDAFESGINIKIKVNSFEKLEETSMSSKFLAMKVKRKSPKLHIKFFWENVRH